MSTTIATEDTEVTEKCKESCLKPFLGVLGTLGGKARFIALKNDGYQDYHRGLPPGDD
jgi:hypothetical protein